ncbi:MAG TPA: DUF4395 domain-containing protein [Solirubrobacteraceae bacterium]|nr:DUF4395 domain-containing protein [Solirubrobacteraceae bacterium]
MAGVLSFPATVNEKAARTVAAIVFAVGVVILVTGAHWLLAVLCVGFVLRVVAGPSLSPLALFATRVVAPRLGAPKEVSGPPKRFAQALGAAMTGAGAVLALGFGADGAATVVTALLVVAAGLEAFLAFCIGCRVFAVLMRLGVVPDEVCAQCADIWARERA